MIDPFGRTISYLRVSVTDRCDLRCVYCMSEHMTFLPKADMLTIEELVRVCGAFISKGVSRIRITGGEPLVRRNVLHLFEELGRKLGNGLSELTLTTNGTQLARYAQPLWDAGVRRINVSLDSLDSALFAQITRWGELKKVMAGIDAAQAVGLKVKINMVALKGLNDQEIVPMMLWAHKRGMDLTLIETMPLGEIEEDRSNRYLPLSQVKADLERQFNMTPSVHRTGGPARYYDISETGGRFGLITPLTHNFCESCNRVRLTCTGTLFMCLGQEDAADLRQPLRASSEDALLISAIDEAIGRKPKGHDFVIDRTRRSPAVARHMSMTGG
jgi:cyclic pyranopterin phosphate synthase